MRRGTQTANDNITPDTPNGWSGGGGSGAIGQGPAGGGGGGYSGGAGGGISNSNNTTQCQGGGFITGTCVKPGTAIPAQGGTSFAATVVGSPVFQLASSQGAGYVQVARLG